MTDTVFIYALNDPTTGRTRYIGKAKDPYERYEGHLESSKRESTHKAHWIQSLLKRGEVPRLEVLDEVPEPEWGFWEREYIRLFRALFFDLTNLSEGGEGVSDPTGEVAIKIGLANRGKKRTPEQIAANHPFLGRKHTPETRARMSAAQIGKVFSTKHRENIGASRKGKKFGPRPLEIRIKQSASLNGKKHSNNSSGVCGVVFRGGKYEAKVTYKGTRKQVGTFVTLEQAADAIENFKKENS